MASIQIQLPPFSEDSELISTASVPTCIPNEPCLDQSQNSVDEFLSKELSCPVLDELYPFLHLIGTKSSSHIHSLHNQIVKGRSILIAERPALHLIWYYKIIFVKPIPHCLLNAAFWERYLFPHSSVPGRDKFYAASDLSSNCRAALGFLRTYAHLIKHESDFRIAKTAHLLPDDVSYRDFQIFIEPFRHIPDNVVTLRYHYGQIRLTRLNWAVRVLRPKSLVKLANRKFPLYYQNRYIQTGQYLERFAAPLLFIFASLTLILSSMQVVLAARSEGTKAAFATVSWGFSVAIIIFIVALSILGCLFVGLFFTRQLAFGIRLQRKGARERGNNMGF